MKKRRITAAERDSILADVRALASKHAIGFYTIVAFARLAGKLK
jgi:hypothetical protein